MTQYVSCFILDSEDAQKVFSLLLSGQFEEVFKQPVVQKVLNISDEGPQDLASALHQNANEYSQMHTQQQSRSVGYIWEMIIFVKEGALMNWK